MVLYKSHTQTFEFQNCILHLKLYDHWEEYVDEDKKKYGIPLTFYRKDNGVGALQISLLTTNKNQEFSINDILKINKQEYINEISDYKLNEFNVFEYEDVQNDQYTKFFHLINDKNYIYATYNCSNKVKNSTEINEAIEIIRSIETDSKEK